MASGVLRLMEKPIQIHHQQQQQQQHKSHEALKCPRCNSSNTKFCYYNNYSLSQPRHFCKACKRYWTRGGTLRNVPVGGGCRKNKRVKKPITTASSVHHHVAATPTSPQRNHNTNPNTNQINPIPSSTTSNSNPLFYGLLPQNRNYPRFDTPVSGYADLLLQPARMNASGLVFSTLMANHGQNQNLSFSSYNSSPMYGGSSSSSASLLASSLDDQQQRFIGFAGVKDDLKMEETQNMMEWNTNINFHDQNKNDQIQAVVSSDPSSILWDTEGGGCWHIGSSVPSLI